MFIIIMNAKITEPFWMHVANICRKDWDYPTNCVS